MNETHDLSEMLEDIREVFVDLHGQSRTGAQLHRIIKDAAPELDIRSVVGIPAGPGALTKFIDEYFGDLLERIGHKGGDVVYGIGEGVQPPGENADPSIWKAFVSPNAVNVLCLDMEREELRVLEAGEITEQNTDGVLSKVTSDEHRTVLDGFLTEISTEQREAIEAALAEDSSYNSLLEAMRSVGKSRQWGEHRRDAFVGFLKERLKQKDVSEESIGKLVSQFLGSQSALHKAKDEAPQLQASSGQRFSRVSGRKAPQDLDSTRALVRSAIDNMSQTELRDLRIPLGAILDALDLQKA